MAMKRLGLFGATVSLTFDSELTGSKMVLLFKWLFVFSCLLFVCSAATLDLDEGEVCDEKFGRKWICKRLNSCPAALKAIRTGTLPQPTICRFLGFEPIVCCQGNHQPTQRPDVTVTQTTPTVTNRFKSKAMCEKYATYVYQEVDSVLLTSNDKEKVDTCGAVEALITNGKNAEPKEYPHMALIGYGNSAKSAKWLCGGSLISERFILSAGHCTSPGSRWGPARWVLLGEYNTGTTEDDATGDAKTAVYEIAERINHPEYKPPKLYNDIALYKLKKNVEFNAYIRPICLNYKSENSSRQAIATGWGHTEYGGRASKILQKARLNVLPTELCQKNIASAANVQKQLPNGILQSSMLCAGDLITGKDTCQGDSGGPLQIRLQEPYCMYQQLGVTSFGKSCGANTPAVYTRVSHYISWIESIVWP